MQKETLAKYLLEIKAVELNTKNFFTWASGIKSPIYCDNRKTLSFPKIRNYIKDSFVNFIQDKYPQTELIAGVATGAIAHAALIADKMNLPMVYIRSSNKNHGLGNRIEGIVKNKQKVVVIEDLISTGGSSLSAVEALRQKGADVVGLIAIFSYNLKIANDNFLNSKCQMDTLTDFNTLLKIAINENYIETEDLSVIEKWREKNNFF
jgi:orotate phosphoribosyltransferase